MGTLRILFAHEGCTPRNDPFWLELQNINSPRTGHLPVHRPLRTERACFVCF